MIKLRDFPAEIMVNSHMQTHTHTFTWVYLGNNNHPHAYLQFVRLPSIHPAVELYSRSVCVWVCRSAQHTTHTQVCPSVENWREIRLLVSLLLLSAPFLDLLRWLRRGWMDGPAILLRFSLLQMCAFIFSVHTYMVGVSKQHPALYCSHYLANECMWRGDRTMS